MKRKPKEKKVTQRSIALTPTQWEFLDREAEKLMIPTSAIIRQLVAQYEAKENGNNE